ncbi:MAG: tetratricopeptide repeat protein, partial [Gemmatimonadota bacterium]|nr:tetratricopeptide repeat protein [Gemmatimonadota bacterium]
GEPLAQRGEDSRSLWTPGDRHYILTRGEAWECYDLAADWEENRDLCPGLVTKNEVIAAVGSYESRLSRFRETLDDLRSSRRTEVDPQHEAALRALGYVGGPSPSPSDKLSWHGKEHFNTGRYYLKRKEYKRARKEFRMALVLDPGYRRSHVALGQIFFHEKRYDEALRHFLGLRARFPDDPEIERLTTVLYVLCGKPEQAEKLFMSLVERYPGNAETFFYSQGRLFIRLKEPETALILFNLLRSRFPGNESYEKGYQAALELRGGR